MLEPSDLVLIEQETARLQPLLAELKPLLRRLGPVPTEPVADEPVVARTPDAPVRMGHDVDLGATAPMTDDEGPRTSIEAIVPILPPHDHFETMMPAARSDEVVADRPAASTASGMRGRPVVEQPVEIDEPDDRPLSKMVMLAKVADKPVAAETLQPPPVIDEEPATPEAPPPDAMESIVDEPDDRPSSKPVVVVEDSAWPPEVVDDEPVAAEMVQPSAVIDEPVTPDAAPPDAIADDLDVVEDAALPPEVVDDEPVAAELLQPPPMIDEPAAAEAAPTDAIDEPIVDEPVVQVPQPPESPLTAAVVSQGVFDSWLAQQSAATEAPLPIENEESEHDLPLQPVEEPVLPVEEPVLSLSHSVGDFFRSIEWPED